jgi:MFS family permease
VPAVVKDQTNDAAGTPRLAAGQPPAAADRSRAADAAVTADAGPGSRPNRILAALTVAMLAFAVIQTSVVPILPTLGREFRVTTSGVSWMMTANLLAAAILTPLLGRGGDLRGRKKLLVVSVAGLVLGSLLAVSVHSWPVLIGARVLQGFGGGILPLAIAVIRDELPRERVVGAVSLVSASLGVGSGLGLVGTGWVMSHGGYQDVFLMGLVLAVAGLAGVLLFVPADPVVDKTGGMDPLGTALLAGWLSALLLAVSEGDDWGWASATTIGLFLACAIGLAAWIAVERRVQHPLIDVSMLAKPAVAVTNIAAACIGFAMYAAFMLLSDFTQTPAALGYGFGASILHSGVLLLPSAAGSFLGAPIGAALIRRGGPKAPMVLGGLLAGGALLSLAVWHGAELNVYLGAGVMGLGIGLAYAAMPAFINNSVPVAESGIANSVNAVIRTVGGAVGTAVAGTILTSRVISRQVLAHTPLAGAQVPTVGAYHLALLICGVLGLAAAIVPLFLRGKSGSSAAA